MVFAYPNAILNFLDIEVVGTGLNAQEKVIYSIGDSNETFYEFMPSLTCKRAAADSLKQVRNIIGKQPVTQPKQIHSLIGKRVFVSRGITTITLRGAYARAMKMYRLKDNPEHDAALIRQASIAAKIEMLQRLLDHPESSVYLHGEPAAPVDIATPIRRLIARISAYPNVTPSRS